MSISGSTVKSIPNDDWVAQSSHHQHLVELLTNVKLQGYKFISVTPRAHEYFLSKTSIGKNLRDIFGWNLSFNVEVLCPMLKQIMGNAKMLEQDGELMQSKCRISSLGNDLFLHSPFPTTEEDSVFFGPDTYRFARFIRHSIERSMSTPQDVADNLKLPIRILDVGCGTGAGGIAAVRALPSNLSYSLAMNDINRKALDFMMVNAQVAGIPVRRMEGDIFETVNEKFDLIIANPPYMKDDSGRAYRDGGDQLGLDLSVRIFQTAFEHLAPGGQLILYTGVAMTSQTDPFLATINPLLSAADCSWTYEEIDPDVFSEELEKPAYADAHRIAAVGLVVKRN